MGLSVSPFREVRDVSPRPYERAQVARWTWQQAVNEAIGYQMKEQEQAVKGQPMCHKLDSLKHERLAPSSLG